MVDKKTLTEKLEAVVGRANQDEKFQKQLVDNPKDTLSAEGLSEEELEAVAGGIVLGGPIASNAGGGFLGGSGGSGNVSIQQLMSSFNEAETLASSVLKKKDDTGNSIIGKI